MSLKLLSPKQVAEILQCTPQCVYHYIKQYNIPKIEHRGQRGRKHIKVFENDLAEFIMTKYNNWNNGNGKHKKE